MLYYNFVVVHHNTGCCLGEYPNFEQAYDRMVSVASKEYSYPCRIVDVNAINNFCESDYINIKFIINEKEIYYIYRVLVATPINILDDTLYVTYDMYDNTEKNWKKHLKEKFVERGYK